MVVAGEGAARAPLLLQHLVRGAPGPQRPVHVDDAASQSPDRARGVGDEDHRQLPAGRDPGEEELAAIRAAKEQQSAASRESQISQQELTALEWFEKGLKLSNNSDDEIHCYTEAIRLNPNDATAYINRGLEVPDTM